MSKNKKYKVAREVAEAEFERWAEAMFIETDPEFLRQEDIEGLESNKLVVVKAIMQGAATIGEDGHLSLKTVDPASKLEAPLVFGKRNGMTLMDGSASNIKKEAARMFLMIANLCGVEVSKVRNLSTVDLSRATTIFSLLMA